jgi:DNA-binding beta-propeller fold protein YncE
MSPEAKAEDLLYVADQNANKVYVYSYPREKLVGTLAGFTQPGGECVDTSGNVFITNYGAGTIVEYQHGGTKAITTLNDPGAYPYGCAFDPITGNLAVTNSATYGGYGHGDLLIYPKARGTPATYTDPNIYWYGYCTYDGKGTLYVDGYAISSTYQIAKLAEGDEVLDDVYVYNSGTYAGGLQWKGKYLAIADDRGFGEGQRGPQAIDLVKVSGSTGRIVKTLALAVNPFANAGINVEMWIASDTVIMPYAQRMGYSPTLIGTWRYPTGTRTGNITGFQYAVGVTLSMP